MWCRAQSQTAAIIELNLEFSLSELVAGMAASSSINKLMHSPEMRALIQINRDRS